MQCFSPYIIAKFLKNCKSFFMTKIDKNFDILKLNVM